MSEVDSTGSWRLLADPTRARIVAMILDSPDGRQLVGKMAALLELRQPTVSHHVRALTEAGVLERESVGRTVWYSIAPEQLDRMTEFLRAPQDQAVGEDVLVRIADDLAVRFAGAFSLETVTRYVRESHLLLANRAHITRHLSSLTSRFAADRLTALSKETASGSASIPEVLFVCVQNAGRSQLAAAILRHLAGDRVRVRTAGSAPATAVRSVIVTALDEIGVPIGGEFPKPLTDEVVRAADVVVTMGCGDACPIYPGRRYLDWQLDDPVGLPLTRVREIRDDVEARVRDLLGSLHANSAHVA